MVGVAGLENRMEGSDSVFLDVYRDAIKEGVNAARSGRELNIVTLVRNWEKHVADQFGINIVNDERYRITERRKRLFLGELYESLRALEMSGNGALARIAGVVKDPLLDIVFRQNGNAAGRLPPSREKFVEYVAANRNLSLPKSLNLYLGALVFLNLLIEDPSLVERVDKDSVRFPRKLLKADSAAAQDTAKKDHEEMGSWAAQRMLKVFPTKTVDLLERIGEYIGPDREDAPFTHRAWNYTIPAWSGISWTAKGTKKARELDAILSAAAERRIYETLMKYVSLAQQVVKEAGREGAYLTASIALNRLEVSLATKESVFYARNIWKGNMRDGADFEAMELTNFAGIVPSNENGVLVIRSPNSTERIFNLDHKVRTSEYVPFFAALLDIAYHKLLEQKKK